MQLAPPSLANLVQELAMLSQSRATGELVLSSGDRQWYLYLFFGRLLYATGGSHRVRRWHRAVKQYCPGFNFDDYQLGGDEAWECQLLHQGINQNQLSLTQAKGIIGSSVYEVLFTLVSHLELSSFWFPKKQHPIALLEIKEVLSSAQQMWQQWQDMGLNQLHPDRVPVFKQSISEPNAEKEETPTRLTQLVNGDRTIWDIALQIRQPVTSVAIALQDLVKSGVLELQTVPDFSPPANALETFSAIQSLQASTACIDDEMLARSSVTSIEAIEKIHEELASESDIEDTQLQQSVNSLPAGIQFDELEETVSASLRSKLGDFISVICLKAAIAGMEDALGERTTAIALTTAGRSRGKKLAEDLGLVGAAISLEDTAYQLNQALGKSGTCLCAIDKIVSQGKKIEVYASETLCSAGEPQGSTRKCTFTLGAVWGALEQIFTKRLQGKQTGSVLRGSTHDVFEFTIL